MSDLDECKRLGHPGDEFTTAYTIHYICTATHTTTLQSCTRHCVSNTLVARSMSLLERRRASTIRSRVNPISMSRWICQQKNKKNNNSNNKKHLKNVGPIRYCEPPLHCQSPGVASRTPAIAIAQAACDVHDDNNAWQRGPLWPHGMGPIIIQYLYSALQSDIGYRMTVNNPTCTTEDNFTSDDQI